MGKNITSKKGKSKQYHLPFDIKAVGKYIKRGRGEGGLKIRRRKSRLKNWGWEKNQVVGNFIHPCINANPESWKINNEKKNFLHDIYRGFDGLFFLTILMLQKMTYYAL